MHILSGFFSCRLSMCLCLCCNRRAQNFLSKVSLSITNPLYNWITFELIKITSDSTLRHSLWNCWRYFFWRSFNIISFNSIISALLSFEYFFSPFLCDFEPMMLSKFDRAPFYGSNLHIRERINTLTHVDLDIAVSRWARFGFMLWTRQIDFLKRDSNRHKNQSKRHNRQTNPDIWMRKDQKNVEKKPLKLKFGAIPNIHTRKKRNIQPNLYVFLFIWQSNGLFYSHLQLNKSWRNIYFWK